MLVLHATALQTIGSSEQFAFIRKLISSCTCRHFVTLRLNCEWSVYGENWSDREKTPPHTKALAISNSSQTKFENRELE